MHPLHLTPHPLHPHSNTHTSTQFTFYHPLHTPSYSNTSTHSHLNTIGLCPFHICVLHMSSSASHIMYQVTWNANSLFECEHNKSSQEGYQWSLGYRSLLSILLRSGTVAVVSKICLHTSTWAYPPEGTQMKKLAILRKVLTSLQLESPLPSAHNSPKIHFPSE